MTRPARYSLTLSVNGEHLGTSGQPHIPRYSRSAMNPWPTGTLVTAVGDSSRIHQADYQHSAQYAYYMSETSPTLHLTVVIAHEDDWYVARCLEIEAVSQGETVEKALANLRDVIEVYLEEEGVPPALAPPFVTSIDVPVPA
jgi:predicted RNase H-like HicB family nuclease